MAAVRQDLDGQVANSGQTKKFLHPILSEEAMVTLKLLTAGGIAGATAKSITAPLARLTILYQVQGFVTTANRQPPPLFTALAQSYFPKDKNAVSGKADVARRFIAGGLAGMAGTLVAYPLDLIRTRLAVQTTHIYYTGIGNAFRTILKDEGSRGLYKGIGGSLAQVGPNLALNYCAYETLRSYWLASHPEKDSPGIAGSLLCGGVSGFVSSTVTFPVDLVRRRMQLQGQRGLAAHYTGYAHVARTIIQTHGWKGFYAGILPEYCKVMPGVAIVYATFEMVKRALNVDHYNAGQR